MTTDHELLELAAKAAGIEIFFDADGYCYRGKKSENTAYWNPLTSDADALRLAVKLRMNIEWTRELSGGRRECFQVAPRSLGHLAEFGLMSGDENALIRRAITRAAAEIGRGDGMSKLWNRLGPIAQGAIIGIGIIFSAPPILWLLIRWWALFFPKVMA